MSGMFPRIPVLVVVPLLALAGVGCGDDDDDAATATDTGAVTTAERQEMTATTVSRPNPTAATTGDDGLTYVQARRAQRGALKNVKGVVIEIDRDTTDAGTATYDVDVLSRAGKRTQISFDDRFRVTRRRAESPPEQLTYAQAVRARRAALRRVGGVVTDVDGEDDGPTRFEVDVLPRNAAPRQVRLSRSYAVLGVTTRSNDDNRDDRDDD